MRILMDAVVANLPSPPTAVRRRFDQIDGQRKAIARQRAERAAELDAAARYLALAPRVEQALNKLCEELFGRLADMIEKHLSLALREVLGQSIALKVRRDFKRGAATMEFYIERDGHEEDIMYGQGGSVANVLSVGLRILALMTLDPAAHRRCIILDEQDCWLAPELVPRLVKIVHQAGRELGFQIIMISHHDIAAFEPFAQRIYRFTPTPDGVRVELAEPSPLETDQA